ncbi:TonB-dependent receptor plug domain-containing protein [Methylomonas rivi]|uniref:TonB-dependent receptor n=1 Tax=Methylomonas rivi TaxID=2952226 RepID=A0ABT1U4N2_9GAMM|nr:TonB-dependent receptor [Methylomonas sp. WSC-6]MCQ8128755.1 TonB-dependent receptor [Methylomonas sp. WSC-6]
MSLSPMRYTATLILFLHAFALPALCAESSAADIESADDLLRLSWEELTELDVSSLSRQTQSVKNSPAAAFVITSEDIRRAGVTSLPEVLRMVPGMNVAKINAWNWAVSARGFNDLYANKLQVMIDGRSIYDPLVSGVYWGQQNPSLQDIERIEVLRGPSGSLWGANAVNGTINIITRSAKDTQGGLLYGGGGTEEQGFGGIRYGGKLSDSTFLRGTVNGIGRDASIDSSGNRGTHDYGDAQNGNLRLDSQLGDHDQLMLEANLSRYRLHGYFIGITSPTPPLWRQDDFGRDGFTGSLQGSWKHRTDSGHHSDLNLSFTQTDWQLAMNEMSRSHFVADFQHSLPEYRGHHLLWGLNYQLISDNFNNTLTLGFVPDQFTQHNVGLFLQDQIDLSDDLVLTLGNRIEHFTYTGWETEPNARLMWTPDKRHSLWAAVSRAVVLPNRAQHSIRIFKPVLPGSNTFFEAAANPNMLTENLLAFELGWRWQVNRNLDIDTALFYNIYDRMQGTRFDGNVRADPAFGNVREATVGNYRQVKSYGLETAVNYRVSQDWRLQASYSANRFHVDYDPNIAWFRDPQTEPHSNPQHTLSLRSLFNLTNEIELDLWGRYVDNITVDTVRNIPAYFTMDVRLGWHPHKDLELSFSGQNLLDNQHPEFSDILYIPVASQIQRGYLAQMSWRF